MKKATHRSTAPLLGMLLLLGLLQAAWIVKVGDVEHSTKEFQDYLTLLRAQGGGEVVKAALRDVEDLNQLLQQFIDRKVLLHAAAKAGYNRKNEGLTKAWEQQKESLLLLFFLSWQIQQSGAALQVRDDEVKGFYQREVSKGQGKAWEALTDMEKAQVQQAFLQMRQKRDYQDKLEKRFKVTRSAKNDDFYVAQVEGTKLKLSEVDDSLSQQLAQRGITKEALTKQNPAMIDQLRRDLREELILRNLLKLELNAQKFSSSALGVSAEAYLWEGFVLDRYLELEFKTKIQVTDLERNEEYARNKEQLKNQPFEEVMKTLNVYIRERKAQQRLPVFVAERKEETPVRRNRDELSKVQ